MATPGKQVGLDELCAANATVWQLIRRSFWARDYDSLRAVNRSFRATVNSVTPTKLRCGLQHPLVASELAPRLPAVKSLDLSATLNEDLRDEDVCVFLDYFQATTPGLLGQLTRLELQLDPRSLSDAVARAVTELLDRCTSLTYLHVSASSNDESTYLIFDPPGATPQEHRANLQRQISEFRTARGFLAPSTWPQHGCLDMATLAWDPHMGDRAPALSALRTTSLVSLTLWVACGPHLTALSALRDLQLLSRLEIRDTSQDFPPANPPPLPLLDVQLAISTLPELEELVLDNTIFEPSPAGASIVIPPAWSQLHQLQDLRLVWCEVDTAQLARISPSLHILTLDSCTVMGPLSGLAPLTSLGLLAGPYKWRHPDGADQDLAGTLVELPPTWPGTIFNLTWSSSAGGVAALAPLRGLRHLSLNDVAVTPEFCRVLCKLPVLESITLEDATADPAWYSNTCSRQYCPTLPSSLGLINFHQAATCPLHGPLYVLASWTRTPAYCKGVPMWICYTGPEAADLLPGQEPTGPLLVQGCWGQAWVKIMLQCKELHGCCFVLSDDAALQVYLAALAELAGGGGGSGGSGTPSGIGDGGGSSGSSGGGGGGGTPSGIGDGGGSGGSGGGDGGSGTGDGGGCGGSGSGCGTGNANGGDTSSGGHGSSSNSSNGSSWLLAAQRLSHAPQVVLTARVTPAAFCSLFTSPHHPLYTLHIPALPPTHAPLGRPHTLALAPACAPCLRTLILEDCSALRDFDVVVLVRAAPGMHSLLLGKATELTDAALAALVACPRLADVSLQGAARVSVEGVMLALMGVPALRHLALEEVPQALVVGVSMVVAGSTAAGGLYPVGGQWVETVQDMKSIDLVRQN